MLNYIYVKDKSGKPCAPSTRQSHFRRLIRSGMAKVISVHPYTVQLLYNVEDTDYGFTLGIDTGRENIGVSVSSPNGSCLYKAELDTCNKSIKVKMDERRRHRGERRRNRRQKKQRKAIKNDSQIKSGDNAILQNRKACKSIKTSLLQLIYE